MISLITTVLNESGNLADWLEGVLSQTVLPEEIIIVDGGSKDGTWEMLQEKSRQNSLVKVWQYPGNISAGRNFAIGEAQGEIIVVTDAGCNYDVNWFRKITDPILSGQSSFVATGFGPWFKANDSLLTRLIAAATIPAPFEFRKNWLPSSRSVAFKKEVWQQAGGYPEWIPLCEDVVFDLKISKLAIKTEYIREPLVFWRPRTNLKSYFKQLFGYTRSDGHGKLWFHRQMARYVFYSVNIFFLYLSLKTGPLLGALLLLVWLDYLRKFWKRWFIYCEKLSLVSKILGFVFLPFIIVYGDIAKMCGWPVGVYERYTGKVKFEN
ncbi:MAG: putative glycosyltransferase [Parcubacteria group bacterium Gr01-1014_13]|nr:MAG: putative glycosyltransferase [Parcubacteria group bacterium Gr01-1014_13]